MKFKRIIGVCSIVLATSCSPESSTATHGTSSEEALIGDQDLLLAQQPTAQLDRGARSKRLASLSGYETIETPQELINRLSPSERAVVEAYYDKYPVVLDFTRNEQLAWMVRNGYPMPEHILAASRLTAQELKTLYESGNVQAGFLYLDREIEAALQSPEEQEYLPPHDRVHLQKIANSILLSGSPFSGYAYANYQHSVKRDPSAALAGYAWAAEQGDIRATKLMAYLSHSADPLSSVLAFSQILGSARNFKPTLLSKKVEPIPSDFVQPGGG